LLTLQINSQAMNCLAAEDEFLVNVIRDHFDLTGTHIGCDTAQCGACTVLINGAAVKSCNVLANQVVGTNITTIEGLGAKDEPLNIMQQAFSTHHALQCGFCTPGLVMRAMAMVQENVPATPEAVREALNGNLCRCTGYQGIVDAICAGLVAIRENGYGV
jgi:aerobic carbon-monoxide dehydrogenase small subunit